MPELRVIYIGVRQSSSDKLVDAFVHADAPEGRVALFDRSRKSPNRGAGFVYEMTGTAEGTDIKSLTVGGGRFIERWPGQPELVVRWEAADKAAKMLDRERKLVERLKKEPRIDQEIATLRRVYHRLPFGDRLPFELMVLSELRKGSPK